MNSVKKTNLSARRREATLRGENASANLKVQRLIGEARITWWYVAKGRREENEKYSRHPHTRGPSSEVIIYIFLKPMRRVEIETRPLHLDELGPTLHRP
jgi:hypothetical protein